MPFEFPKVTPVRLTHVNVRRELHGEEHVPAMDLSMRLEGSNELLDKLDPALQWKTWVRLAFVEAGSDWRSLNKLAVENGHLRDFLLVPAMHSGVLGVNNWAGPMGTVTSRGLPNNGNFSVADPRFDQSAKWSDGQAYGVRRWDDSTGAIAGQQSPGQGAYSVADPRHAGPEKHSNEFRIVAWDRSAQAVTSAHGTGQAVADPRGPTTDRLFGKYHCAGWDDQSRTVIGGDNNGAYAVADPRPNMQRGKGDHYLTGGHYGVVPWDQHSYAVASAAGHDNGHWSVADPRPMPALADKLVCRITALDNTWHRPFTTLELAALQSLFDPEEWFSPEGGHFMLAGNSDQRWREGIGNAVPSAAATGIAEVMGETLLLAWTGETFRLSMKPIWVQPVAIALTVQPWGVTS